MTPENIKQYIDLHLPQSFPATNLMYRGGRFCRDTEHLSWSATVEQMPPYRGHYTYKIRVFNPEGEYHCTWFLNSSGKLTDMQLPSFGYGDPQPIIYGTML